MNAFNQGYVPGYTTFDLDAAYRFDLLGKSATLRAYGDNITDRRYWASTGSSLLAQASPRTVKASLSLNL